MKALVTGGAGFIGSHLVDYLVDAGHEVAIIDNLSNGLESNINPAVKLWWGCSVESHHAKLRVEDFKPDVIFHLAALGSVPFSVKHPGQVFEANVNGSANMFNAARKVGARVVFASSASYYGDDTTVSEFGPAAKTEDMPPRPLNHYGASKVCGEHWGKAFAQMHGLCFTAMRFFNVFGPRQRDDTPLAAVVPRFVKAVLDGELVELHNGGVQTRDMTYVANVVDALIAVRLAPVERVAGQAFNVCGNNKVSIGELLGRITAEVHPDSPVKGQATPPRKGDIQDSFGSYEKLKAATGWEPKIIWQDGIKLTVEAKCGK